MRKDKKRILIAYDGSESADAALYGLLRAGLPDDANALVVSVAESWFPPPLPPSYESVEPSFAENGYDTDPANLSVKRTDLLLEAQELAGKAANWIQSNFPCWDVNAESLYGSPASELLSKADQWKPDLIVAGSHGRSAIGRLFLGSISHKLVTEATCSVRVGRSTDNSDSGPRVLIGVDGSDGAAEAVRVVAGRQWSEGTEIRFVAVYDPVTPSMAGLVIPKVVHWVDEENRSTVQLALKMVESFERQFRSIELLTSHLVVAGEPKRVLLDEAHRWRADCIFVGARGLSRINRFLLGSVSAAVAARAHCSVEVIRSTELNSGYPESKDCGDYA